MEEKLGTTDYAEEFTFTPNDILLKRDIDFINKKNIEEIYQRRTSRTNYEYIDDIELNIVGTEIVVKQINFRESIFKLCQKLY